MNYDTTYVENENSVDVLVENEFGEYSGTIQFTEYNPYDPKSTLQNPKIFLESDILKDADFSKIREIDKLSVKSSPKNKRTILNIIQTLYIYVKKNDIQYVIAEVNPYLIEKVNAMYGINPIKVGGMIKEANGYSDVQPIILKIDEAIKQYEKALNQLIFK